MKKTLAITCYFLMCFSLGISHAGPVESELKSFRCLVPDWSKTSGGTSPALSPDGKTLVYITSDGDTRNDQIWVLSTEETYNPDDWYGRVRPKQQEAWRIECPRRPATEEQNEVLGTGPRGSSRNVDWSPDGKSVAFICHGKLYVAGEINHQTKSAKVRLLADVVPVPEELLKGKNLPAKKYAEPVLMPRWSPDGKKIAFERPIPSILGGNGSQVCVVDLDTGKETTLAKLVLADQPWSPDSKRLLVGSEIISVTGGTASKIDNKLTWPTWSPKADRLAYIWQSKVPGVSILPTAVYTCDLDGKNVNQIAKSVPSAASIAAAKLQVRKNLINTLYTKYPGIFSFAEIEKMRKADIDDTSSYFIIQLAEGLNESNEIGGDFKKEVDAAYKQFGINANIDKIVSALPWEKSCQLVRNFSTIASEIGRPVTDLIAFDRDPVWSPDGKKIAFWRSIGINRKTRLVVADVTTNKSRTVFESDDGSDLSWTSDSKSLVLAARRTIEYKESFYYEKMKWTGWLHIPSYSEIWILQLK